MTSRIDFGNVISAMITPFQKDGKVDLDEVELLANYLLKNGTDTLLLIGSTGEAAQLTSEEKWSIVKRVREFTPKDSKIMVATSDTNTERSISKTKKAFELGADGVLVAVPEYIKPPQSALIQHFGKIANSVPDKPIVIYNVPSRTGSEILPETVAELAHQHSNIIGIKQSMGNLDKVSELKMLCPSNFQIYSGDDSLTLPMLALGARGVVSVASHLEGNLIQEMIRSFQKKDILHAQKTHNLLFPLCKTLFMTTNPLPVKEALYQKKLISSPTLRTLGEMSAKEKAILHQNLSHFELAKRAYFSEQGKTFKQTKRVLALQEISRKDILPTER